jgi:hypothetical protein
MVCRGVTLLLTCHHRRVCSDVPYQSSKPKVAVTHALYKETKQSIETRASYKSSVDIVPSLTHLVTRHTSHVARQKSQVTRHTSHISRRTSKITSHTSHISRHKSQVTRQTSNVKRHTFLARIAQPHQRSSEPSAASIRCHRRCILSAAAAAWPILLIV